MSATLTPNRDAAKSALWWLFQGGSIVAVLANTSAAGTPPASSAELVDWLVPTDYTLSQDYDLFLTGGSVVYDTTVTSKAKLPRLQFVLDYATTVTYTDVLLLGIPAYTPGSSPPSGSTFYLGVIHESSPVTLLSTQSKTYNVDLFAQWI